MEIRIHSIHFAADEKLGVFLTRKLEKLHTYYDRILSAEVFLRLENEGGPIQEKVVEIKLTIPRSVLFAKETDKGFETAADRAVNQLRRQLRKHVTKIRAK